MAIHRQLNSNKTTTFRVTKCTTKQEVHAYDGITVGMTAAGRLFVRSTPFGKFGRLISADLIDVDTGKRIPFAAAYDVSIFYEVAFPVRGRCKLATVVGGREVTFVRYPDCHIITIGSAT